jgi:hypothetical protein
MSNNYNINNPGGFFNYPGLPIPTGENPCEGNDNEGNCGAGLNVINSSSISFEGSGNTCTPLLAFVNLSQVAGNKLTIFGDGLYTSGGTGIPSIPSTQIAFGSSGNTLTSSPNLTWNPSSGLQTVHLLVSNTAGDEDLIIAQEGFVGFAAGNTTFDLSSGGIDIITEGNSVWTSDGGFDFVGAITAASLASTGTTMVVANSTGLLSTQPLPIATIPGGSNTQIQYNNNGGFGGSSGFTFNSSNSSAALTGELKIGNPPSDQYTSLLNVNGNAQVNSLYVAGPGNATAWANWSAISNDYRQVNLGSGQYGDFIEELTSVYVSAGFKGYAGIYSTPYMYAATSGQNPGSGAYVCGVSSLPVYDNAGATTPLQFMYGYNSCLNIENGTVTDGYDYHCYELNEDDRVPNPNPSVTNHYNFHADGATKAVNNYGVYINGTQLNYFGGNVMIGSAINTGQALQVSGNTLLSGSVNSTSLKGATTQMVVASAGGLLSVEPIPSGYTFTGNTSQYTTGAGTYVTFPTNLNQFINGPGYITGVTAVMIDTALGYTPIAGPAGSNQQIQFNNNGAFGGSIDFLWTGTSLLVTGSTEITYNGVGVVNGASGLTLINNTPATSTQEQYSPALIFGGNAWNTASSGSNYPVQYAIQEYVQSANTPYHGLNFMFSTNGGSSYTNIFSVGYEGGMPGINIGGSPTSGVDGGYILIDTAILPFNIYNNSNPNANNAGQFLLGGGAASNTSNSTYGIGIGSGYSAGAGSGNFAQLLINGTINQTTGSTGVMRGLYINPTLTSYANYYAIQVAAGNVVHAAATATYASLRIPTGTAPTAPIEGDMWKTGTHLFIYLNGATVQIV